MQQRNTTNSATQSAYRAVICRVADLECDSGWPVDIDLLEAAGALTREEQAAVCAYHPQVIADEFSVDPAILAAFLRRDIGPLDLAEHIEDAAHKAAWEAIRSDVLDECAKRAELAEELRMEEYYGSGTRQTDRERLMGDLGLSERDFG